MKATGLSEGNQLHGFTITGLLISPICGLLFTNSFMKEPGRN